MNVHKAGDIPVINCAELGKFLRQKRTLRNEKIVWTKKIISAAMNILKEHGQSSDDGNLNTRVMKANIKSLSLLSTTPFNKIIGMQYGLDIWDRSEIKGRKVFSARWE